MFKRRKKDWKKRSKAKPGTGKAGYLGKLPPPRKCFWRRLTGRK